MLKVYDDVKKQSVGGFMEGKNKLPIPSFSPVANYLHLLTQAAVAVSVGYLAYKESASRVALYAGSAFGLFVGCRHKAMARTDFRQTFSEITITAIIIGIGAGLKRLNLLHHYIPKLCQAGAAFQGSYFVAMSLAVGARSIYKRVKS